MKNREGWARAVRGAGNWLRRQTYPIAATTLLFAFVLPRPANCQVRAIAETAIALTTINSSLVNTIGGGLNNIHAVDT
nr:hypothetical protein [Acidobacteriota bacterium]